MVNLTEYNYKIMNVARTFFVLGSPTIAESVVEWCKKHPNQVCHKVMPHGLRLTTVAGKEPAVVISLDAKRTKEYFTGLGPTDMLVIKSYGILFAGPNNPEEELPTSSEKAKIRIAIARSATEQLVLFEFTPESLTEDVLLGRINITETGFTFYDRVELAEEAESALLQNAETEDKSNTANLENIEQEFSASLFGIPVDELQPTQDEEVGLEVL